jgi:hypothetical protein
MTIRLFFETAAVIALLAFASSLVGSARSEMRGKMPVASVLSER